ncbi:hypothetical protein BDV23DRAFT_189183 [Aspergillus alliaceus]|uniref:Uncharacterized protein n=1 Tax=Petromyces alliaceus TaxID=209559 RepID=A0A5N7BRM0_PETAA|nr:hypothetical protein BDV23DRAFT_189183 [Aspergillus alliaceus]
MQVLQCLTFLAAVFVAMLAWFTVFFAQFAGFDLRLYRGLLLPSISLWHPGAVPTPFAPVPFLPLLSRTCGPCHRGGPLPPPASQDRAASVESTASVDSLTRVLLQVGITDPITWRPDFTPEPSPVPIPDTTRRSDPSIRVPTTKVCGARGKRRRATTQSLDLDRMDRECPHCGALYWRAELYPSPTTTTPSWEKCCRTGCLPSEPMPDPPPLIRQWLSTNIPQAKLFRKWIRILNSAVSYTSMGYRHDPRLEAREALYIFQLQGIIYHMQGPLRSSVPSHAQLYFIDMESANALQSERYPLLKYCPVVLEKLDKVLRRHNPFYKIFFHAFDILNQFPDKSFLRLSPQLRLVPNRAAGRRYNIPSISCELGAFLPDIGNEYQAGGYSDIQLYLQEAPVCQARDRTALLSDLHETTVINTDETLAQLEDGPVPEVDPEDPETPAATINNNTSPRPRYLSYIHPEHALYGPLAYPIFYSTGGRSYH